MADSDTQPPADGASPLRPGASVEEIQARVAHLSSAGATDDAGTANEAMSAAEPDGRPEPVPGTQPVPGPGPQTTVGATAPVATYAAAEAGAAVEPPAQPGKPRRGLRAIAGGGGALVAALVILFLKFGFKLAAVGVAAVALSGAFGDRYDQLPSDQRASFEQRYEAAIGTSMDNLSDKERAARMVDLVSHGASRLDDGALVLWNQIDERAHAATDVATCARIARGWFSQDPDRVAVSDAVGKSYEALSIEDFGRVIDLGLKAMEAEKAGSPPVRSVSDATMDPVFSILFVSMSEADNATLNAIADGKTVTDDAACSALRGLDTAAAKLSATQYASWAVWLSTP